MPLGPLDADGISVLRQRIRSAAAQAPRRPDPTGAPRSGLADGAICSVIGMSAMVQRAMSRRRQSAARSAASSRTGASASCSGSASTSRFSPPLPLPDGELGCGHLDLHAHLEPVIRYRAQPRRPPNARRMTGSRPAPNRRALPRDRPAPRAGDRRDRARPRAQSDRLDAEPAGTTVERGDATLQLHEPVGGNRYTGQ